MAWSDAARQASAAARRAKAQGAKGEIQKAAGALKGAMAPWKGIMENQGKLEKQASAIQNKQVARALANGHPKAGVVPVHSSMVDSSKWTGRQNTKGKSFGHRFAETLGNYLVDGHW